MRSVRSRQLRCAFAVALLCSSCAGLVLGSPPAAAERLVTAPQSVLTIDGTATLVSWQCRSGVVGGFIEPGVPAEEAGRIFDQIFSRLAAPDFSKTLQRRLELGSAIEVTLAVPVHSFFCGDSRMERDMYEALKSERDPLIIYFFERVLDVSRLERDVPTLRVLTRGVLEVAGVKQEVDIAFEVGRLGSERFRIRGRKTTRMTDFGVKPPTAFFGLIRAHDTIHLGFDVLMYRPAEMLWESHVEAAGRR